VDLDTVVRRSPMPVPLEELWAWHLRPGGIERGTAPWDRVRVAARTGGVEEGARVTLSVPFGPLRLPWVSEYRDVDPRRGFAAVQISGPFAHWVHVHGMADGGGRTSILEDRVEYAGRGGPIGRAMARRAVTRRLSALLRYRHETLAADLAAHARVADRPRLTVGITGASGLLGTALTHFLTTGGHRVVRFTRGPSAAAPPAGATEVRWDPARGFADPDGVPPLDACVHFAGAGVADRRWTPARKALVRDTRVEGTATLARALAALPRPPRTLLCASATGFYGSQGRTTVDESAPNGTGFLAGVVRDWEAAAHPARAAGLRVAHLRLGLVITPAGGFLKAVLPLFKAGVGGPVGDGTQGLSWVGIDDVIGAFHHALFDERIDGPVNVTAPEPVSNAAFTRALGQAIHRPAVVPAPAFGLRLLLGREMADETALSSAWVTPSRLAAAGYAFRHATLGAALAHYLP
jgi:uncharacterized protein (TIGR01777 family)